MDDNRYTRDSADPGFSEADERYSSADDDAALEAMLRNSLDPELVAALKRHLKAEAEKPDPQAEAQARRAKARRRRRRAIRDLLVRIVLLAVVIYVLFFQIIGVLTMPNGDMYPRVDAGDLVLYYRLDKDVRAQDLIVFDKDPASIKQHDGTGELTDFDDGAGSMAAPAVTAAPQRTSAEIAGDTSFQGRLNRLIYDLSHRLNLAAPDGKQRYVLRVVACEGDTVEITDTGTLVVNGNSMIESNIFYETTEYVGFTEYPLVLGPGECFVLADKRNGGADSRFFGPVKKEEILGTVITIARRNNL